MPMDRPIAEAIVSSMEKAGWQLKTPLEDEILPNPLDVTLVSGDRTVRLLMHIRRITPQKGEDSDHHRPPGEWHTQMIFDHDIRGERGRLATAEGALTVLMGYAQIDEGGEYILAAYDPSKRISEGYGYSASLQVKESTLQRAAEIGLKRQERETGEIIVAFPVSNFPHYLEIADEVHRLTDFDLETEMTEDTPAVVRAAVSLEETTPLPELGSSDRERTIVDVKRKVRSAVFSRAVKRVYNYRCAICGFQYDDAIDAAHIIAASEPEGEDTYENGVALCPLCHRLYDTGLVLVDGSYRIHINEERADELKARGIADSLQELKGRLRESLYLPEDERHRPSPDRLEKVYRQHLES